MCIDDDRPIAGKQQPERERFQIVCNHSIICKTLKFTSKLLDMLHLPVVGLIPTKEQLETLPTFLPSSSHFTFTAENTHVGEVRIAHAGRNDLVMGSKGLDLSSYTRVFF